MSGKISPNGDSMKRIKISMTEEENDQLKNAADKLSLPLATFIRMAALAKARGE